MKANHVPAHSDFMTEMTLIKIACAGTLGLIPCCLIGTRSNVSYVCMYIYYVTVTKKRNKCKAWKIAKLQTKQEWQTSKHLSFALLPKSIRPQKRWQGPRRNSTAASQGAKPQLVDSLPVTYQRLANKCLQQASKSKLLRNSSDVHWQFVPHRRALVLNSPMTRSSSWLSSS